MAVKTRPTWTRPKDLSGGLVMGQRSERWLFALMLPGSYVGGSGAGLAFRDWPLFDGKLMPEGGRLAMIHAMHRFAAAAVGLLLAYVAYRAWRTPRWHREVALGSALALAPLVAPGPAG